MQVHVANIVEFLYRQPVISVVQRVCVCENRLVPVIGRCSVFWWEIRTHSVVPEKHIHKHNNTQSHMYCTIENNTEMYIHVRIYTCIYILYQHYTRAYSMSIFHISTACALFTQAL